MYRDLHRRIALTFTLIVSGLLVVSGVAYIATDFVASRTAVDRQLERRTLNVLRRVERAPTVADAELPGEDSGSLALIGPDGKLVAGSVLPGLRGTPTAGFSYVPAPWGTSRVYAVPVDTGPAAGSVLVMEQPEKIVVEDLGEKAGILALVVLGVSSLTYALGAVFARRILSPVRENMERLEQFTADAGHELRTPLAAAGAALDAGLHAGDLETAATEARSEIMRAGLLVDRLLELARLGRLTLEPQATDLSALVRESVDRNKASAGDRNLSFETDIADGIVMRCDASLVGRMVDNLVENAVKFANAGTSVRVELTETALGVTDLGQALPATGVGDLFEPFVQGDVSRSSEGHGLGLALVSRIAGLHGWTVRAESSNGATTFSVRFRPGRTAL